MVVDFIKSGNPDCPILRMYGNESNDYKILINEIGMLIDGIKTQVNVTSLKNFLSDSKVELILEFGKNDNGVVTKDEKKFTCSLTIEKWKNIRDKLISFNKLISGTHQWLDETSEISWLVSVNGKW